MTVALMLERYREKLESLSGCRVDLLKGRKYVKVVIDNGTQRTVHSFVEKNTGNLYKPADWNAPAKGVRYNVLKDWTLLESIMDQHGSYLYQDTVKTLALPR